MPVSLGSTSISKLYLGTTEVTKAYLGTTEVFGVTPNGLLNNLLSYYKLDGNAEDSQGTNDGTILGATYTPSGKINGAYEFDGDNDSITTGGMSGLGNSVSVSTWIYIDSASSGGSNYPFAAFGSNARFYLYISPSTGTYYSRFGSSIGSNSGVSYTTGEWVHYVGVADSGDYYIYVNGVEIDSGTYGGSIATWNSGYPEIGGLNRNEFFEGKIDEVGIWGRALSSTDVQALYNSGYGLSYENFTL